MEQNLHGAKQFESDGFIVFKSVVPPEQIEMLISAIESARQEVESPGLRNLLNRSAAVKIFASSSVSFKIAEQILGATPVPVRAILFDKTPAANWYVTWHQDLSIPVTNKVDVTGYGPWSTKDGILHVQPPAEILERMVSLRIHLDECSDNNGAIKFIAGSHLGGILDPEHTAQWRDHHDAVVCPARRGDIIAMRPLVLHSSSMSEAPDHRRVLHLEYASADLPAGMEWAEA